MGTSKSNMGPKGISSPIPSWSNDSLDEEDRIPTEDNEEEKEELKPWGHVKRSYSNFVKHPNKASFKKLTNNYRKANGGDKELSKSAIGGRKGARKLIQFLSAISKNGFDKACEEFQLGDLEGLSPEDAINKICNLFENIDGTDEGSAAKAAAVETINQLYENYTEDSDVLNNLDMEQISDYLSLYISNYIFERLSIEVSKALEDNKFTKEQVMNANDTLKDFVSAEVELNFAERDFSSLDIQQQNALITEIFTLAYSMI